MSLVDYVVDVAQTGASIIVARSSGMVWNLETTPVSLKKRMHNPYSLLLKSCGNNQQLQAFRANKGWKKWKLCEVLSRGGAELIAARGFEGIMHISRLVTLIFLPTVTDHCTVDWLNQTEDLRFRKGGRKPPHRLIAGESLFLDCYNIGRYHLVGFFSFNILNSMVKLGRHWVFTC